MSPAAPGQQWRAGAEWGERGEEGVEGGWCRRTEGTGTAAGTADTVGTAASADNTRCMTWRLGRLIQTQLQWGRWGECWRQGLQVLQVEWARVLYVWVDLDQMIPGQGPGEGEPGFL